MTGQRADRAPITYVEFSLSASEHPIVAASIAGGRAVLEELVPRGARRYAEYVSVVGIDPDAVLAAMADRPAVTVDLLVRDEDRGLFEFLVDEASPVVFLCLIGCLPRQVESRGGRARLTAEVPAATDAGTTLRRFQSVYPDAELREKRHRPSLTPHIGDGAWPTDDGDLLTDRQHEVLITTYQGGFYNWPRTTKGEDLAASLDISPSTFHQHRRAAERHLVGWFLNNRCPPESHEAERRQLLQP